VDRSSEQLMRQPGENPDRRQFLRGMAATGAVAGAGGLLAACSGNAEPASTAGRVAGKHGGNLKIGFAGGSSSDTLDPHRGLTYLDTGRFQALYQPLVQLTKQAQVEYVLAESITPHNGSLSEWVIRLRPGVTFHSGKELAAGDVIFSLRRIIAGDLIGSRPLGPIDLKGVKALDKLTVLVPMKRPFGSFVDSIAGSWYYLYIVPSGFNPKIPDGTGPFAYQSFTPGHRSVFVANKTYWKPGLPYAEFLTIIDFSDNAAVQDALVANVIQAAGQLDPPQLSVLANVKGIRTVASQSGQFKPFTMRVDQKPFRDPNVRQAMRYLVGRQQMIESALDGFGVVASDVFAPYDVDFDPALHRQQDIPKAKFLLGKAGLPDLTVTLTTSAIATGTVTMATVFAEQAKAAGVTVNLNKVAPATFFATGKYLNWTFSQDYYSYSSYLTQVAQSFLGPASPFNETHSDDAHYIDLYDQANATSDPATRRQIEYEMQQLDFNQGAYIIPIFSDILDAYSDQITGYTTSKVGEPMSNWDFEHFSFV
jgi:peptide/nickel transport system substrate-binding protein